MRTIWYPVLLLVVGGSSLADAAALCVPKSGEGLLKVREECKKNEIQLDPATIGLESAGPAVYDATGKKVGAVISTNAEYATVIFKVAGHSPFALLVYRDFFVGNSTLFFETTNCSGTPFLEPRGPMVWPITAIASPGSTVHFAELDTPLQTIVAGSVLFPGGACQATSTERDLFPPTPLVDLSTMFTPPFKVR